MIGTVLRVREWGYSKLAALVGILAWALPATATGRTGTWLHGGTLFGAGILALGYIANDIADRDTDASAGKPNASARHPRLATVSLATAAAATAAGAALLDPPPGLAALTVIGALAYSFPPRLKEYPVLGPIVGAAAQLAGPAAVALAAGGDPPRAAWAWAAATLPYGVRLMLVHQTLDHGNDVRSGTRSFVTRFGKKAATRAIHWLVAAELVALGAALLLADVGMAIAGGLALAGAMAAIGLRRRADLPTPLTDFRWVPLADLHSFWSPLAALGLATLRAPAWGLVLIGFVVLFRRSCSDQVASLWFTLLRTQREPA